jgi:hypothetical protein
MNQKITAVCALAIVVAIALSACSKNVQTMGENATATASQNMAEKQESENAKSLAALKANPSLNFGPVKSSAK